MHWLLHQSRNGKKSRALPQQPPPCVWYKVLQKPKLKSQVRGEPVMWPLLTELRSRGMGMFGSHNYFSACPSGCWLQTGGQESNDSLGGARENSSKCLSLLLTCCCHPYSLSFTLHSLRDSEGTAQQPWTWGGTYRKSWHSQKARREGVLAQEGTAGWGEGVGGTSSSSPSLPGGTLCPPALFLHFCPDPVSGLPKLWLTGCWQLELPDMSSFAFPF